MLDIIIFLVVTAGYILGGIYLARFIKRQIIPIDSHAKSLGLSFFYATYFGFGVVGGAGDPGFAHPFPILIAAFFYIWIDLEIMFFIKGVLVPLLFWWGLIFIVMLIRDKYPWLKNRN